MYEKSSVLVIPYKDFLDGPALFSIAVDGTYRINGLNIVKRLGEMVVEELPLALFLAL